jgi:hypothetical protein
VITLVNQSGNLWLCTGMSNRYTTTQVQVSSGQKTLSDVLDRVRFRVNGAASFDAGAVNIMWEF